jgi:hypothetical protein
MQDDHCFNCGHHRDNHLVYRGIERVIGNGCHARWCRCPGFRPPLALSAEAGDTE